MGLVRFVAKACRYALGDSLPYRLWLGFLLLLAVWGLSGYFLQLTQGLIWTNMRDQVSWGFYIGNFTFLVGVAAAAIILIIPAYVYDWKPIKEIAVLGEVLAISAMVMCMLFVAADVGRPDKLWHLIPGIGHINWPSSLLAWDVLALNLYFILNVVIVGHLLYSTFQGRHYSKWVVALIIISIPVAVSIHTVTAFIYMGLKSRPFWNSAILAPRFLASALCSGPAILLILFQILQRATNIPIQDEALYKVAEIMAYAMFINLFLLGAEAFQEIYSHTEHWQHFEYLFKGIDGHTSLVPYGWAAVICSVAAFFLFITPRTRQHFLTMNLGCLLIYAGVYIEKGMGLVIPGMTPDTLGEIYEYAPSMVEVRTGVACYAIGFLVYTLLTRVAVGIMTGELTRDKGIGNPGTRRPGGGLKTLIRQVR